MERNLLTIGKLRSNEKGHFFGWSNSQVCEERRASARGVGPREEDFWSVSPSLLYCWKVIVWGIGFRCEGPVSTLWAEARIASEIVLAYFSGPIYLQDLLSWGLSSRSPLCWWLDNIHFLNSRGFWWVQQVINFGSRYGKWANVRVKSGNPSGMGTRAMTQVKPKWTSPSLWWRLCLSETSGSLPTWWVGRRAGDFMGSEVFSWKLDIIWGGVHRIITGFLWEVNGSAHRKWS